MVAALAVLLAAQAAGWTAAVRSEARTQTGAPGQRQDLFPLELALDPAFGLLGGSATFRGTLEYAPHLAVQQVAGRRDTNALHRFAATGDLRADRSTRLHLEEHFALGRNVFTPLTTATLVPPDPRIPQQGVAAAYLQNATDVRLEHALSPTSRAGGSVGYLADGGATAEARNFIPLLHGPRASAFASFEPTHRDTMGAVADVQVAHSSGGTVTVIAGASGNLAHAFDRRSKATLSLGAAAASGSGTSASLYPVAGIGLQSDMPLRGQSLSGTVSLKADATPDRYTGGAYERAELSAQGDARLSSWYALTTRANVGQVLSGAGRGQRIGQVELLGTVSPGKLVSFSTGGRVGFATAAVQAAGASSGATWQLFATAQFATAGAF